MMKSYRVIHIPYNRTPYQRLLLTNLKHLSLDVEYGRIVKFPAFGDISLLSNLLTGHCVDIIHLHWQHKFLLGCNKLRTILRSLSFITQVLLMKTFGKRVVWTVHNITNHEKKHEELEIFFSTMLAHCVDAIIVHCESARRRVREIYKIRDRKSIVVIPHGSYLSVYKNSVSVGNARKYLNVSPTDLTFLFFGNIRPYKGVIELIHSFRRLDTKNATLLIVGKPHNKRFLELLKEEAGGSSVRLIPRFVSDDEIQIYLNAADILVLPYTDILTSGVVMLAISFGKPIIAPRTGCLSDVLDNSGSFLYDSTDKYGLLNAMKDALFSRGRLREMGDYNFTLAKKFDWQDIAASTHEVYRSCFHR